MKLSRLIIFTNLILLFSLDLFAGGKKVTTYTWRTEVWTEQDYLGSGYHFNFDKIKPNIWLIVRKVDGEISDAVGLPNNVMAGNAADWSAVPYDRLNLYSRIPTQAVDGVDGTGKCLGSGRCYGDWVNNDELWQADVNPYLDSQGNSFLELDPDMHGQKRTRYRIQVFVEDNQAFWLKDSNETYSGSPELYYPLNKVVFRITDAANPPGGTGSAPAPAQDVIDTSKDEYYEMREGKKDFLVANNPEETRLRFGKYVYNFNVFHTFKQSKDYYIMVTAEDIEGNRRTLRVMLTTSNLKGIKLRNVTSDGHRQ